MLRSLAPLLTQPHSTRAIGTGNEVIWWDQSWSLPRWEEVELDVQNTYALISLIELESISLQLVAGLRTAKLFDVTGADLPAPSLQPFTRYGTSEMYHTLPSTPRGRWQLGRFSFALLRPILYSRVDDTSTWTCDESAPSNDGVARGAYLGPMLAQRPTQLYNNPSAVQDV